MYSRLIHVGRFLSPQRKMPQGIKKLMITSIALSQLALPSFSHASSLVFADNFESGAPKGWSYSNCQAVKKAVDGGSPYEGSYMLQCGWNGAVPWNHPDSMKTTVLNSWPYTRETFIRFWLRLDRDMDNKDGAKLFRIGYGGECGNMIQRDPVTAKGGTHEGWTCGPNSKIWMINVWGSHNFEDRQWHKFEIYIKHDSNGTDGEIKTWQDGKLTVLSGSYPGYPYKGRTTWSQNSHWYPFIIGSNWSSVPGWEHDASNHWYIDKFEIYSDQGSGAAGSMADATIGTSGNSNRNALSAPKNLHVIR